MKLFLIWVLLLCGKTTGQNFYPRFEGEMPNANENAFMFGRARNRYFRDFRAERPKSVFSESMAFPDQVDNR